MAQGNYENVRIILAEPNEMVREALRSFLRQSGFTGLQDFSQFNPVKMSIERNQVDILITDMDLPGGDVSKLISKLRHHEIGNNPFMLVIFTTASPSSEKVMQAVECGSDDLIVKPASAEKFLERIIRVVDYRKPFVVTTDYIGPDRRNNLRMDDAEKIPTLDVPNPAKLKINSHFSTEDLQRAIDEATTTINEHKLERHGVQVTWLVNKILPHFAKVDVSKKVIPHLDRLLYVAEDISRRLAKGQHAHVSELCRSLRDVTAQLRKGYEKPNPKDIKLLPELAKAIETALRLDSTAVETIRDITRSVGRRKQN